MTRQYRQKPQSIAQRLVKAENVRPFWALAGEARTRWESLPKTERRAAVAWLLAGHVTAGARLANIELPAFMRLVESSADRLGFESIGQFLNFHTEQVFVATTNPPAP